MGDRPRCGGLDGARWCAAAEPGIQAGGVGADGGGREWQRAGAGARGAARVAVPMARHGAARRCRRRWSCRTSWRRRKRVLRLLRADNLLCLRKAPFGAGGPISARQYCPVHLWVIRSNQPLPSRLRVTPPNSMLPKPVLWSSWRSWLACWTCEICSLTLPLRGSSSASTGAGPPAMLAATSRTTPMPRTHILRLPTKDHAGTERRQSETIQLQPAPVNQRQLLSTAGRPCGRNATCRRRPAPRPGRRPDRECDRDPCGRRSPGRPRRARCGSPDGARPGSRP